MLALLLLACSTPVEVPEAPARDPSAAWGRMLARIVTPEGLVDYDRLRENPKALGDFVGWVAVHGPETDGFRLLDDDRRLAWHLNAYNALVLWGVLQHWPIESVRDLPGPFGGGSGFFWKLSFRIDGESMSLHRYENNVILATYEEPLSHAALNCASRSCPPLRNELYQAKTLEHQLEDQMRVWVASGAAVRTEGDPAAGGTFVFSPIFDWYEGDFAIWAGAANPCKAVRPYATPELGVLLDAAPDCPRRFYDYDWSLNSGHAAPPASP